MPPTPEDILACRTAHELFGDAVLERRDLKRAYAGLIKRYDPDSHPDVFTHIRTLYEAARRGDTGAPELETPALRLVDVDEGVPDAPADEATPATLLRDALHAGDTEQALSVLDQHDLDLRIDSPGLWFATVADLADQHTFELPASLLQSWLDAIDTSPDGMPVTLLERIELLTTTGLAYVEAREDPAIPEALLDLIALWGRDAVTVAEGFMGLGQALGDQEAAWEAHRILKERHPTLWFPYVLMRNLVTAEAESFDETKSIHLDRPPPRQLVAVSSRSRAVVLREVLDSMRMASAAATLLAFPVAFWWESLHLLAVAVMCSLVFAALSIYEVVFERRRAGTSYPQAHAILVDWAHQQVLFPHEVLDQALTREQAAPRVLMSWQQDLTTLLRVLTPQHIDRIRDRVADAATPQETP